ncbi:glycerol uptake facilitator protein [Liquorilactobacillus sucicola DSM 21376 = JCM 15457]|nr:glycerol uptake facilitator protein [Liquorilactobacillus sucicola DSM 21376 = JCM 15457]
MDYSLTTRLAAEFFGTAIMIILGNGSVATVDLERTKGSNSVGSSFQLVMASLL